MKLKSADQITDVIAKSSVGGLTDIVLTMIQAAVALTSALTILGHEKEAYECLSEDAKRFLYQE